MNFFLLLINLQLKNQIHCPWNMKTRLIDKLIAKKTSNNIFKT